MGVVWVGFAEGNLLTTWTPTILGTRHGPPGATLLLQTTLGLILATLETLLFIPECRGAVGPFPPLYPPPTLLIPSEVGQEPTQHLGPVHPSPLLLHRQPSLQTSHLRLISSGTGKD